MNTGNKQSLFVGIAAVVLAWGAHTLLFKFGFFERYDESDMDHYTQTAPLDPNWSDRITMIAVTEDDYRNLFGSRSPLDSDKLIQLIRAVQAYRPRVIGVDFLTGDWASNLPSSAIQTDPPVVWARDGQDDSQDDVDELPSFTWNGVAGYTNPPAPLCYAAPANPPDSDQAVRRYPTAVRVRNTGDSNWQLRPTMASVLASGFPDRALDCTVPREQIIKRIRFTGRFHKIQPLSASLVLNDSREGRTLTKYLRDRIVLIGGKYAAARDRYWSPIGYAYGLDLLAHETESELSGAIGEFSFRTGSIVNLLVSLAVFGLMLLIPNERWRAICSIGVVIPLAFIAGWLLYVYADFFSGIRSALLAVPIGVLAEHFVKCPLKDRQ